MNIVALLLTAVLLVTSNNKLLSEQGQATKMPVYLGIGYNLITGNPLSKSVDTGFAHSIYKVTYNKGQTTSDGRYIVPDGMSHRIVSSCSFDTAVTEHRGTTSYTKSIMDKITTKEGMSTSTFQAAFSKSRATEVIYQSTILQKMSLTHATAQCQAYYLSVDLFKNFPLNDDFQNAVNKSFHENNWQNFIEQYGTHFVKDVVMGGRAIQQIAYSFQSVSQLNALDIELTTAAKGRFAMFFGDKEWDWQSHIQTIKYTQIFSNDTVQFYLGGHPPRDGSIITWVENVISNPMPIRYSVLQLTQIFDKIEIYNVKTNLKKVKASFVSALSQYCTKMGCKKPVPDLPKPPPSQVEVVQSPAVGQQGGIPFQYALPTPMTTVSNFLVHSGANIDGIQLLLTDGVKNTYTPHFGGVGGAFTNWPVPANQYITQVEYWNTATILKGLVFITNKGTKSIFFGQAQGGYAIVTFPQDYRIIGIHGRCGALIDKLGFMLGKTIYPNSSDPYSPKQPIVQTMQVSLQ